jgi:hypothetical protein
VGFSSADSDFSIERQANIERGSLADLTGKGEGFTVPVDYNLNLFPQRKP